MIPKKRIDRQLESAKLVSSETMRLFGSACMTEISKCPKCRRSLHRIARRWYERIFIRRAYQCNRCSRRRYNPRLLRVLL
jgi:hypothetical protein